MSQTSPTPTSNNPYYSAHRGPVFGPDGNFHHFARQCDPVHLKNGYWKFCTFDDDRRAYTRGLNSPEDVLKAQDVGDGVHDDIMLCWVSGELDTGFGINRSSVGTAAMHLQCIYNERRLLGKTLSFRGRVPLYPVSTDENLIHYRLTRYGNQKGVGTSTPLSPTVPSGSASPSEGLSNTCTPTNSPSRFTKRASPCVSTPTPTPTASLPQNEGRPVQPLQLELTPVIPTPDHALVQSSPLIAVGKSANSDAHSTPVMDIQASLHTHNDARKGSPHDLQTNNMKALSCTPGYNPSQFTEPHRSQECSSVEDRDDKCLIHGSDGFADASTDDVAILSLRSLSPSDLFHAQMAVLPCMDCGSTEAHASDCWINEAKLSLKPTEGLTTSDLQQLADHVSRFDPGPWTTHFGPQQELEEDTETQVQGMAEVIRNLDANAPDRELQGLDDQFTILLWALKSFGNVQILEG